jgi:hypothetical protein
MFSSSPIWPSSKPTLIWKNTVFPTKWCTFMVGVYIYSMLIWLEGMIMEMHQPPKGDTPQ